MQLSNNEFLSQFEAKSLLPEEFTHIGHLRLAWLYIKQYDLDTAIDKLTNGINAYASSLGAPEKFHHTITEALARIIQHRIKQQSYANFEDYLHKNDDLTNNALQVLHTYYTADCLNSEAAKLAFVAPDKKSFYE